MKANDACRRDILDRLASFGPLPSRDLPDTCKQPWASTGWTNKRNVTQLLVFMVQRGEVATPHSDPVSVAERMSTLIDGHGLSVQDRRRPVIMLAVRTRST